LTRNTKRDRSGMSWWPYTQMQERDPSAVALSTGQSVRSNGVDVTKERA
jgi:hypothetical protein